jgi:Flp pilus assembly protein CpaB
MANMTITHRLVSTRKGTIALAVLAALAAGILVLIYVNRYRSSVRATSAAVTVLVAKSTIPKGTPGRALASGSLFTVATVRESQLRDGAFSDPSNLIGRAASRDIYQGQQLTSADFSTTATSLASRLTGTQRVVAVPLDSAHGLTNELSAGDRVDVYVGFNVTPVGPGGIAVTGGQTRPVLRVVMQNVIVAGVARVAGGVGGGSTPTVSLQVSDVQAAELAFASDNGKIWLALRPAIGAKSSRPAIVTAETMLLGIKPIAVERALGGRP